MEGNFYFGWFFYNLICGILLFNFSRKIRISHIRFSLGIFFLSCLALAVCGNSITADYAQYKSTISVIASTKDPFTHLEGIYVWLIHQTGDNYFLYQFIIYTYQYLICYFLVLYSLKKCKFSITFMALFAVISLYGSISGRVYLCYITSLTGIILFFNHRWLFGSIFLILGACLHKIGIILTPLFLFAAIIPLSFNRKKILLLLIFGLTIIVLLRYIIYTEFGNILEQISDINPTGAFYLAKEEGQNENGSLWWKLIGLYRVLFFITLSIRSLYLANKYVNPGTIIRLYFKISFLLLFFSVIYFCLGFPDNTIGERLLSAATIPVCIIMAKLNEHGVYAPKERRLVILGLIFLLIFNNAYIVGVSHVNQV